MGIEDACFFLQEFKEVYSMMYYPNVPIDIVDSLKLLLQAHGMVVANNWRVWVMYTGSWVSSAGAYLSMSS